MKYKVVEDPLDSGHLQVLATQIQNLCKEHGVSMMGVLHKPGVSQAMATLDKTLCIEFGPNIEVINLVQTGHQEVANTVNFVVQSGMILKEQEKACQQLLAFISAHYKIEISELVTLGTNVSQN